MSPSLHPIQRFWRLLSPYRKEITSIYLYAIMNGLVNLSLPLGIQAIINFIQGGQITVSWILLIIFVLVGILLTGAFQLFQLRLVENIQQSIFARSAFEFTYRLPKIRLSELDSIHAPELVNRFFDTLTIQKGLPKILIDFSLATFQIFFGLILMSIYSPYFLALALLFALLVWIIIRITGKRGLETSLMESKYKYRLAHWLEDIARSNKSFKLLAQNQFHMNITDGIGQNYLSYREKHFRILLTQFRFFIAFKIILAAGFLVLGGLLVFNDQMNIGQFVASEIIIILVINSVEKIINCVDTIYDVLTALDKIGYVTDLDLESRDGVEFKTNENGLSVEIKELTFKYPDSNKNLFKDLNLIIHSGAKVLLTGQNGSGKTTLLRLLLGMHQPRRGEILYNHQPLRNIKIDSLYQDIGFFLPTNQLFEASIEDNIKMGRDIENKKWDEVLELLDLDKFIAQQPKGLHTIIDSEGKRLPRGIIQKLLIARALISDPELLIMEEPMLALNDEERVRLIDYIMNPNNGQTVVVAGDFPYWKEKATQIVDLSQASE